jgi:hypothetical protein
MSFMEPLILESCHSTWVFDTQAMRFRRVLKGVEVAERFVVTAWRPYYGLDVDPDSESFWVWLNPEGTRLLSSWRHRRDCAQCGEQLTGQLSLDELRMATGF